MGPAACDDAMDIHNGRWANDVLRLNRLLPLQSYKKWQRLACLLTTGAIKSAHKIALEAMLDLPPLQAMVKKEAAQSAFKPNTEDMQGHLKIYEDFQGVMDLQALSDKMPIT
jgi:hypothetical protein